MRVVLATFVFLASVFALNGCATIVGKSGNESFSIQSEPSAAKIEVREINSGNVVDSGVTPKNLSLTKKRGYFLANTYEVKVSKEGFKDVIFKIKPGMNGWYIAGNFVFGGALGWFIVDPLTGAMWNLKSEIEPTKGNNVVVKLVSDLSQADRAKLNNSNRIR